MITTILPSGQLEVPDELVRQDHLAPGDEFEIERLGSGKYQLTRKPPEKSATFVDLLLACPEKGWFVPPSRHISTDDVQVAEF